MVLTQLIVGIYKDSLILWDPPSNHICLVLLSWYKSDRFFDTIIDMVYYTTHSPLYQSNIAWVICEGQGLRKREEDQPDSQI